MTGQRTPPASHDEAQVDRRAQQVVRELHQSVGITGVVVVGDHAHPGRDAVDVPRHVSSSGRRTVAVSCRSAVEGERFGDRHLPQEVAAAIAGYIRDGIAFVDYSPAYWSQQDPGQANALAISRCGVANISPDWMRAAGKRQGWS